MTQSDLKKAYEELKKVLQNEKGSSGKDRYKEIKAGVLQAREVCDSITDDLEETASAADIGLITSMEITLLEEAGKHEEAIVALDRHVTFINDQLSMVARAAVNCNAVLAERLYQQGRFSEAEEFLNAAIHMKTYLPAPSMLLTSAMLCADCAEMEMNGIPIRDEIRQMFVPGTRWNPLNKKKAADGKVKSPAPKKDS